MRPVLTPNAPSPGGHYSQAVIHNGIIYVAGQLPIDPASPDSPPGDITKQTRTSLSNVRSILEAAGSGLDHVLQMTVYVADIGLWPAVNEEYARMMADHRPARAVVPVPHLHHGYLIEIQAVAAVPDSEAGS